MVDFAGWRMPIQYALSYPEKWEAAIPGMDFTKAMQLDFAPPDRAKFPCLSLATRALEAGGTAPAALNAANEEAVAAFLRGQGWMLAVALLALMAAALFAGALLGAASGIQAMPDRWINALLACRPLAEVKAMRPPSGDQVPPMAAWPMLILRKLLSEKR